jgi:hypothetical protein
MTNDSSPAQRTTGPIPLRNIPFVIVIDGVEVRGEITCLYPNDITVEITDPVAGLSSGVHIPYFAMGVNSVGATINRHVTSITAHGQKTAEWLLRAIYNHSRGRDAGWGVHGEQRPGRGTQSST